MLTGLLAVVWAAEAHADPCRGELPSPGTRFAGTVHYVGDGDSLCVGPTRKPQEWIEVRVGDYYAPELHEPGGADAKRVLENLALGRRLSCRAGRRSYDRVVGYCTLNGRPLGRLLAERGGAQGGRGWHRTDAASSPSVRRFSADGSGGPVGARTGGHGPSAPSPRCSAGLARRPSCAPPPGREMHRGPRR